MGAAGVFRAAPVLKSQGPADVKKRFTFMIDLDLLDRIRSIKSRTGISDSEQIRQAIRMWLESRDWPIGREPRQSFQDE